MGDGKEYTMLNYMTIKLNSTNITFRDLDVVIVDEETEKTSSKGKIILTPIIISLLILYLGLFGI